MIQPEEEGAGAPVVIDQAGEEEDIHDATTGSIGHPRTPGSAPHSMGRGGALDYEGEVHPVLLTSDTLCNSWKDLV